jgi:predicted dithiol-disulfide oxidoreductase (DUF899 family)
MSMSTLVQSKVVSREERLAAGEALLAKEKVMTRETRCSSWRTPSLALR